MIDFVNSLEKLLTDVYVLRDYSNTKSTRFRIFMSGIVQAVTRAISRSRANSPEPQAPEPQVSRHSRRGGTLNPEQVEALLGNDVRVPMTDDAKYEFAHKMRLVLSRGHKVWIQAVWGHKEETEQYTVIGQVYLKNRNDPDHSELKARWDDEQDMEYSFPFPDIDYYSLAIAKVQARMPGGERVEHLPSVDRLTISDRVRGVVFLPPEGRHLAKLRERAVRAVCKATRFGSSLRVVWLVTGCWSDRRGTSNKNSWRVHWG